MFLNISSIARVIKYLFLSHTFLTENSAKVQSKHIVSFSLSYLNEFLKFEKDLQTLGNVYF